MTCADCGFETDHMKPETVAKGSTIREPGEVLCRGCSSRRTMLVRQVTALPTNLADIKAKRMVS